MLSESLQTVWTGKKYDTVIYSGWLGSRGDVKEFLAFEKELPKVMGARKDDFE